MLSIGNIAVTKTRPSPSRYFLSRGSRGTESIGDRSRDGLKLMARDDGWSYESI